MHCSARKWGSRIWHHVKEKKLYLSKYLTHPGSAEAELHRQGIQPRGWASLGGRGEGYQKPFPEADRASLCARSMEASSLVQGILMVFSKEYQVIFCDLVPRICRFTTSHMPWVKYLQYHKLLQKRPHPSHTEWESETGIINVKTQHRRTVTVGQRDGQE